MKNREKSMVDGRCILCGGTKLERLPQARATYYATGDRKSIQVKQEHVYQVICKICGNMQFLYNDVYKNTVKKVFEEYDQLHDCMWDEDGGVSRLERMCRLIDEKVQLPERGVALDIGCGNGDFLHNLHRIRPQWTLYGEDIGAQFRKEAPEGVGRLYGTLVEAGERDYNFISINATLSLADNAVEMLAFLKEHLKKNGIGFIMETNFAVMPWEMYEIETLSLFTEDGLRKILESYGFKVIGNIFESGMKEAGLYFINTGEHGGGKPDLYEENKKVYEANIAFIDHYMGEIAEAARRHARYGIYGTSVAGRWLMQYLMDLGASKEKMFFLDEDTTFCGKESDGLMILHPQEVSGDATVFLPFAPYTAVQIRERMKKKGWLLACELI